jgi:hypothetical protein
LIAEQQLKMDHEHYVLHIRKKERIWFELFYLKK